MFNNPLDSFHNTVAEAKAEREQLDRLLTISTPKERLLLFLVFLLIAALASWLVFGTSARAVAIDGVVLEQNEVAMEGEHSVPVLVWIHRTVVPEIKRGLPVTIKTNTAQDNSQTIDGDIQVFRSQRHVDIGASPLEPLYLEILIDPSVVSTSLAGERCSIVVQLGNQSPLKLIGKNLL